MVKIDINTSANIFLIIFGALRFFLIIFLTTTIGICIYDYLLSNYDRHIYFLLEFVDIMDPRLMDILYSYSD